MIIWGTVFHFMIAFLFTSFLFLIYPFVKKWIKNKFVTGTVYGLFIWVIMNRIVVPLSNVSHRPFDASQSIIAAAILICMIGIPVAWIADVFFARRRTAK
jgi:uncharacterized membrane protein YagU involved in acid resistance